MLGHVEKLWYVNCACFYSDIVGGSVSVCRCINCVQQA